jgi:hypothetical protein
MALREHQDILVTQVLEHQATLVRLDTVGTAVILGLLAPPACLGTPDSLAKMG